LGVSNIWGRAAHCWNVKFGEKKDVERMFREWAKRRHKLVHRNGRSGETVQGLTKARHGQHPTREEAVDCLAFFGRLIALVDFQLNQFLYGRQPRRRKSRLAIFDLTAHRSVAKRASTARSTRAVPTLKRVVSIAAD
jgi:hypothetical protein